MVSRASHVGAVNISYECLGGDEYLISVNLFRDCQDQNDLPDDISVYIFSTCNSVGYKTCTRTDILEVSQLCDSQMPNSACNGGFQPGVEMGVYQIIVELEPCIDWRIIVSEQNRDGAIVNLVDPSSFGIHTEAFLNNTSPICNSSPQLSLLNLPYICINTPLNYNLGFLDPDGDSLAYSLTPAQQSTIPTAPSNMDYTGSYSGAEPMTGMTIDPQTGQISVTPTLLGRFNTVVEVREYRNGSLIGIVHYDFLFLVNACPIPPPEPDLSTFANVSGGGYPLDDNTIGVCPEDDFCFEIAFPSSEPTVSVYLTSNINLLIPGATETVTGTNPATIQFCGTIPPDFNGGSFIITAIDDACPVYGQNFYTIDFAFRQPIKAFPDTSICLGETVQLSAINDTSYTWFSLAGDILSTPSDVSCNPCQQPFVSPDSSTYYVVEGAYANSTCANTDTILVDIPLSADFTVENESCLGDDGIIDIEIITGSGDYDVIWEDIGEGPLLRNDLVANSYYVLLYDNVYGCNRIDTFNITQLPPPDAYAGLDFEVCGLSANLNAIPSYGIKTWSPVSGINFTDIASETTSINASAQGTYELIWSEDAGSLGCMDSDTVEVTFYAEPSAQILTEDSVCGLISSVDADIQNGTPDWYGSPGLTTENPNIVNTQIQATSYGLSTLYLSVENGTCITADTLTILFIEQPVANAGSDVEACGLEAQITGVDAIGSGEWTLPADVSSTANLTDLSIPVTAASYGSFDIIRTLINQIYCVDADTTSVLFTENPVVNIGSDQIVCDSLTLVNFTLPVGNLSWELSPNLADISMVTSPEQLSGSYGQHQAILHADNGYGCIGSDTLNLNFVVQPVLQSVIADTVCALNYALNAQTIADNQYWLPPTGATITDLTDPNSTVTAAAQGDYTFLWVAENGGFCRDTSYTPVTFYNQPLSNAGEDQILCDLTTNLDATASHGVLVWEDQPGLTFSNPLGAGSSLGADWYGTYTISLTETNGICTDSDTVEVQFISTPIISNDSWECTGIDSEFILTFNVSLGDTANYEVQGVEGTLSDFSFQSIPILSDTPLEVILEDFGYCGGDTLSGTQFCPILTNAGTMNPDTLRLCGNELVEVTPASGPSLDGNDTLLYAFHDGSGTALGTIFDWNDAPEFIFSTILDFDQTYFISAVAGNELNGSIDLNDPFLSVSAGTPVEFYELPSGEISGDFITCPYDTVFIPVDLSGAMPQTITYSVADQNYTVFADTPQLFLEIADSGMVNLISTNSAFCTGNVEGIAHVSYHRIPNAVISGPPAICDGDTATIEIEYDGAGPFGGSITQDLLPIQIINTSDELVSFNTTTGGIFSIVGLTDQNCMLQDTISINLTIKPLPNFSAGDDLSLCTGDTVLLGSTPVGGQIYNWEDNESLLADNLAQVPYAAFSNSPFPQSDLVLLTAELNGCSETDSATIIIHPLPVPQIVGSSSFCSGDSIMLIGFGGDSYEWSPIQLFENPYNFTSQFSASTNTVITLNATSTQGCQGSLTKELEILESPSAFFEVSDIQGCAPLDIEMEAFSANTSYSYFWNIRGMSNLGNSPIVNTTLTEPGNYTVSLSVTAPNGCSDEAIFPESLTVFSTYAAFNYLPERPDVNNPEVYFINTSPLDVSSTWKIDSLIFSDSRNATYTFPDYIGGNYTVCLEVTDSNNCKANICEPIKLKSDFNVFVPNAFTPNGDGLNDLFYPVLSNISVTEYKFWITDSRGRTVFSTTDQSEKWNGSTYDADYYGENKSYTWHLIAKPEHNVETQYFKGHVLLVR